MWILLLVEQAKQTAAQRSTGDDLMQSMSYVEIWAARGTLVCLSISGCARILATDAINLWREIAEKWRSRF